MQPNPLSPARGRHRVKGGFVGHPYPPSPCPLPPRGEREKACKFQEMVSYWAALVQTILYCLPHSKNLAGHYWDLGRFPKLLTENRSGGAAGTQTGWWWRLNLTSSTASDKF